MAVPECPVVIVGHPLHQVKGGPRQTAYGPVPVVSDPHVQVPRVEVLKVLIHWHKLLKSMENRWVMDLHLHLGHLADAFIQSNLQ